MILRLLKPPPSLRSYISSIVYYDQYTAPRRYERLLPDGEARLIVALDDGDRIVVHGRYEQRLGRAWIAGVHTGAVVYRGEREARSLCIQFRPGGLYALFGVPASEFRDAMVDTDLVSEARARVDRFREVLLGAPSLEALYSATWAFLTPRAQVPATEREIVAFLLAGLGRRELSLSALSERAGYSTKHLIHLSKKHIGLSPMRYRRLQRFNDALALLSSPDASRLSNIAHLLDDADQAHFTNEFRACTGYSPGRFVSLSREYRHVLSTDTAR